MLKCLSDNARSVNIPGVTHTALLTDTLFSALVLVSIFSWLDIIIVCVTSSLLVSKLDRSDIRKNSRAYSITERRGPELIPVFGSQPAGDMSHKPGGRLPLLSARPSVTPATHKRAATSSAAWRTEAQWV